MSADYTKVFQDADAVEKYETVTYAPDSYASRINDRQRAYLRELVKREFSGRAPVQHDFACGTGRAIRTLHGLVRVAHGYDTSAEMMAKAAEVGTRAEFHQVAGGRAGAVAGGRRRTRDRDHVPAVAQCGRRDPGPGAGVRGQGAAHPRRRHPGGGEPRQHQLGAASAGAAALRRALVRRAVPRAGRGSARPARLRDRGAARPVDADAVAAREPDRPGGGRGGPAAARHRRRTR